MFWGKLIDDCQLIPRGYGFSYRPFNHLGAVFHPWPLNHIVSLCRRLWWWLRHARTSSSGESAAAIAYSSGYRAGREDAERKAKFECEMTRLVCADLVSRITQLQSK